MLSKINLVLVFIICLAGQSYAKQRAPTIVLVLRHAEKAAAGSDNPDPSLSEAGVKRAQELIRVAEDAGVSAIYTTQFKRTRETAQPLAAQLGVPIISVEVNKENLAAHPASLAKEVLSKHKGQTVAIIGHSNTVPLIVEALGGKKPPAIDDATEFDHLFIVIIYKPGDVKTIKARYGKDN
ncbi:MAG TPA: phosphoglycerate mutase family protein [Pyrinomonadaceae bacterium]|jgi:broad specificity phosphatase PhoE